MICFLFSKQTKIPKITLICVLVFQTNQKSQTKTSLICVYCNHATHFYIHICLFIFSHPFIFVFSFFFIFSHPFSSFLNHFLSSSCHIFFPPSFPTFLFFLLSFFFVFSSIPFFSSFFFISSFLFPPFHFSTSVPFPIAAKTSLTEGFVEISVIFLTVIYCIYIVCVLYLIVFIVFLFFNIKFASGLGLRDELS